MYERYLLAIMVKEQATVRTNIVHYIDVVKHKIGHEMALTAITGQRSVQTDQWLSYKERQ